MRTGRSSLSRRISTALITTAAVLGAAVSAMYSSMREQAREICGVKVRNEINTIAAEETLAYLSDRDLNALICRIDGETGTVSADAAAVTALENSLRGSINRRLAELGNADIPIHIGTLTGFSALNERGPEIGMILQQEGSAETSVTAGFTEAGVNQTRYSLRLNVKVTVLAQLPGYSETVTAESEHILCDTVIIGDVPSHYYGDGYRQSSSTSSIL